MHTSIHENKTHVTKWTIQRRQYEVEKKERHAARETDLEERAASTNYIKAAERE